MPAGEREPSPIPRFVERLFDLPVERWIAWARLALSGIALSGLAGPASLTASQRERYAYYGRAARTSLELSDKVHD